MRVETVLPLFTRNPQRIRKRTQANANMDTSIPGNTLGAWASEVRTQNRYCFFVSDATKSSVVSNRKTRFGHHVFERQFMKRLRHARSCCCCERNQGHFGAHVVTNFQVVL